MRLKLALPLLVLVALALPPSGESVTPLAPIRLAEPVACEPAPIGDPMPEGAGHAHANAALHQSSTPNLARIGRVDPAPPADAGEWAAWDGILDVAGVAGARFGELDVAGGRGYLAYTSSPAGVAILDLSDPAAPSVLGTWRVPGSGSGYVADVKASPGDGRFFYAAFQGNSNSARNGVYFVDARDPASPVLVTSLEVQPYGVHMMWVHAPGDAKGVEWVYAPPAYGGGTPIIASLPGHDAGRTLLRMGTFRASEMPHDLAVFDDAITGKPLMALANGPSGVVLADLSNPAAPVTLGTWQYQGADSFYAHTIRGGVVEGKRVLLVSPEGGALGLGAGRVAKLWALDATDPTAMKVIGAWANPGNHVSGTFTLSTHNFQWVEGRVYLAHYHGGVWVIDASTLAALAAPVALAYALPAEHSYGSSTPNVWDMVLSRGYAFAADTSGGVYVYHFACDATGPSGPTSYG